MAKTVLREIVFYGRGGQGAVVASRLLAAAAFKEGKDVQSFPFFGVERRGAPVTAYTRVSTTPIRKRTPIREPDYVVVLDPTMLENTDVAAGLKKGGSVIINSRVTKKDFTFDKKYDVFTFDASAIASKYGLGSKNAPIVNTSLLGAFAKFTGEVGISSLVEAVREGIAIKTEENAKAIQEAFDKAKAH